MAAKKKAVTHNPIDYKKWIWVIDNLSKDQMSAHDSNPPSAETIILSLNTFIEDGFKVTCKWDSYNKCFQAQAVCGETGYNNSGLCISARSDDAADALSILHYKYFFVAERDLRGFADKVPVGVRG